MELPTEIRRGWERRFPDLIGKWTHWIIIGDGSTLAIVGGKNLIEAVRIIEENYGKFSSIKACRAVVDEHGNLLELRRRIQT
jgi:hypothetical protein